MGRLFGKKKTKEASENDKKGKQKTAVQDSKQVQGVLVFTLRPLNSPQKLLQQISEQQRSKGYTIAPKCIAKGVIAKDPNDKVFITEIVKKEFPDINMEELIKRTSIYPFQASDGNNGKCCIVFDRI
jgi:hypothetical protein